MRKLPLPLKENDIKRLKVGERLLLTGTVYTARDAAHKKLMEFIKRNNAPIELKNQTIYYTGPTPPKPGQVIGSCGPTTSGRMDSYTPFLLQKGMKGMIGKGERSVEVIQAIKKHKAIYFIAAGGCGAWLSQKVKKCDLIAYPELGCEAIYKLELKDFPVIVGIDSRGRDIYKRKK